MIPIKIETLLEGRKVERNRIEYKEGFNPSEIVHTICSYANDIAGVDGGYLVIGVKTENGMPILPPVGVSDELLDDIQLKIFQYGNKIEPRYIPKIEIVEYQGVNLVYLKWAAGDAGPYHVPVDVYSKKETGKDQGRTMKYWIRPASLTVEAKQSEIAELFEKFASLPFVDRINNRASMEHIRRGYLEDFIRESNSSLIEELNARSLEDLLVSEEVAEEKDEGIAIKNIGLLMFGDRPDKLISGSKIELVKFHDKEAEASDFTEKTFYGPIWKQVRDVLDYIKTNLIEEKVVKIDGKAEADRFFNYPYNALEEALVNAVLHKNYKEDVPVEIRIYLDQIQIINFPGPDHYIDMEKFAAGKVRARRYRNPKIGEFLKEIDLSEKKSTGISKILRELKRNGSPMPEFETDADRTYMITTIRIHEKFETENEDFAQKNERSFERSFSTKRL
ncbi:MAG: putative DNA binding domain-containing protein [Lachnospiraceae bacterium]|nr:putative DNA binding domain-containing protein [Lachnospiraceae bacterium]